jgi:hypothetical protein
MLTLTRPLRQKHAAMAIAIDQTMRAKLPVLPNPLVASWDERQRLVIDRSEPWIIGPLEIDPYLTKAGGYPFPARVADQLQRISAGGARFHRIAIAHEVDRNEAVAALLPKMTPAGLPITPQEAKACLGRLPSAQKPKQLAAAMDKAVKNVIGCAVGATTAVLAAPAMMLDPIVFGVIGIGGQPRTGEPAVYYPLAAWKW